ncbi:MAG: DsrE family protein [Wenzhouxiangellaceae bacterium]|nr:DsrE family protein [Wenzhouxiangellaceae bacterium]
MNCFPMPGRGPLLPMATGLALLVLSMVPAWAQSFSAGPVVTEFGPVVEIPDAFNLVPGEHYRVLFDVAAGRKDEHALNRRLESVARFLNMHARAGIDPSDLEIEVITHGGTTWDVLSDAAYRERFGRDNPNTALLNALSAAGVVIHQCGQSAAFNGVAAEELSPAVSMAVSAMTVLVRRQSEGWVLLP